MSYHITLPSAFFATADLSSAVAIQEADNATAYHALASKAKCFSIQLSKKLKRGTKSVILVCNRGTDAIALLFGAMSCGVQVIPVPPEQNITAAYLSSLCDALGVRHVVFTPQLEDTSPMKKQSGAWLDKARPDGDAVGLLRPGKIPSILSASHSKLWQTVLKAQENLRIEPGCQVLVLNTGFGISILAILCCLCNGGTLVVEDNISFDRPSQISILFSSPVILANCPLAHNLLKRFPQLRAVAVGPGEPSGALTRRWKEVGVQVWALKQAHQEFKVLMSPCLAFPIVDRRFHLPQTEHTLMPGVQDCAMVDGLLALEESVWYVKTLDIRGILHSFMIPENIDTNKLTSYLVTRYPQFGGRIRLHARQWLPVRADGAPNVAALEDQVRILENSPREVVEESRVVSLNVLGRVPMALVVVVLVNACLVPIAARQTKDLFSLVSANLSMTILSHRDAFFSLMYLLLRPCMRDGAVARFLPLWARQQMASFFCNRIIMHMALATCTMLWLLWFLVAQTVSRSADSGSATSFVVAVATWTLFVAYMSLGLAAAPLLRRLSCQSQFLRHLHRSLGPATWLMALAISIVQLADNGKQGEEASGQRTLCILNVCLLAVPSIVLVVPWLTLRRVNAYRNWTTPDRESFTIKMDGQLVSGARHWMTASSPLSSHWRCASAGSSCIVLVSPGVLGGRVAPSDSQMPLSPAQEKQKLKCTMWIQWLPVFRTMSATRFFQSVVVLAFGKSILAVADGNTHRRVIWSAAKEDLDNLNSKLSTQKLRQVPHPSSPRELSQVVVEEAKEVNAEAIFIVGSPATSDTVVAVIRQLRRSSSLSVYVETEI